MCVHGGIRKAHSARARGFYRDIHAIADKLQPRVRRAFLKAIENLKASAPLKDIQNAIALGSTAQIEAMFVGAALQSQLAPMVSVLREGFVAAADVAATKLTRQLGTSIVFDIVNPASAEFIAAYEFGLITQIDNAQRAGVRAIVANAFERGGAPITQAREIRQFIGLTAPQTQAAIRFANGLDEDGVPRRTADKMLKRKIKRDLQRRAINIARTETINAANLGQQGLWRQSISDGFIDSTTTSREWIVTPDDRLCPICESLDGATTGMEEDFKTTIEYPQAGPKTFTTLTPPVHPSCRCALGLVFDQ